MQKHAALADWGCASALQTLEIKGYKTTFRLIFFSFFFFDLDSKIPNIKVKIGRQPVVLPTGQKAPPLVWPSLRRQGYAAAWPRPFATPTIQVQPVAGQMRLSTSLHNAHAGSRSLTLPPLHAPGRWLP